MRVLYAPRFAKALQGAVATCDQGEAMEKTLLGRVLVGGLLVLGVIGVSQSERVDAAEPVRVRKNAKDLSAQEKQDLVGAYHAMKVAPSPWDAKLSYYDQFVYWHKYAFACENNAAHMGPAFLPWHRQFLLMFENGLRDASGKDVTIPYWDFTDMASTDAVFAADFLGENGDPKKGYAVQGAFGKENWVLNVLDPPESDPYQYTYLIRNRGTDVAPNPPTPADIQTALDVPTYDSAPWDAMSDASTSFRNNIEGWRDVMGMECDGGWMNPISGHDAAHMNHNGTHLWAGGIFESGSPVELDAWSGMSGQHHLEEMTAPVLGTLALNTSPNDPAFWLLHANIDRVWDQWSDIHGEVYAPESGAAPGHNLNDKMWPYTTIGLSVTPADMLDRATLGYEYLPTTVPEPGSLGLAAWAALGALGILRGRRTG